MQIKAAIFDMDGTLINSLFYWEIQWKKFGEAYLGVKDYVPDPALDAKGRTMRLSDCALMIKAHFALRVSDEEILAFFADGLWDFYKECASLKPGALETLRALQKAGVKMCIASATDGENVRKVARLFGIDQFIPDILSCCDPDVGKGKDQPDVYEKALRVLGSRAEETACFEDSPVALETAKKMGLVTVGVYDRYNYGHDRLEALSDIYLPEGHPMDEALQKLMIKI